MVAILSTVAVLLMPSHVSNLAVYQHGQRLMDVADIGQVRLNAPPYRTCHRNRAILRPSDHQLIAEYVSCWHTLYNYTAQRLVVRWR